MVNKTLFGRFFATYSDLRTISHKNKHILHIPLFPKYTESPMSFKKWTICTYLKILYFLQQSFFRKSVLHQSLPQLSWAFLRAPCVLHPACTGCMWPWILHALILLYSRPYLSYYRTKGRCPCSISHTDRQTLNDRKL